MLLVIPTIEILDGRCCERRASSPQLERTHSFFTNPSELAKFLRNENSKSLHVVVNAHATQSFAQTLEALKTILSATDIPIEVEIETSSGMQLKEAILELLQVGVFRVFIPIEQTTKFQMDGLGSSVREKIGTVLTSLPADQVTNSSFLKRVILRSESVGNLQNLVQSIVSRNLRIRMTVDCPIRNRAELEQLEALDSTGVDSFLFAYGLFSEVFPCQALWRTVETMPEVTVSPQFP